MALPAEASASQHPHGIHLWFFQPWHQPRSILWHPSVVPAALALASQHPTGIRPWHSLPGHQPCCVLMASNPRFPLPRRRPRSILGASICDSRCLGFSLAASSWHPSAALAAWASTPAASSWHPSLALAAWAFAYSILMASICGSRCPGVGLAASSWHPSLVLAAWASALQHPPGIHLWFLLPGHGPRSMLVASIFGSHWRWRAEARPLLRHFPKVYLHGWSVHFCCSGWLAALLFGLAASSFHPSLGLVALALTLQRPHGIHRWHQLRSSSRRPSLALAALAFALQHPHGIQMWHSLPRHQPCSILMRLHHGSRCPGISLAVSSCRPSVVLAA